MSWSFRGLIVCMVLLCAAAYGAQIYAISSGVRDFPAAFPGATPAGEYPRVHFAGPLAEGIQVGDIMLR